MQRRSRPFPPRAALRARSAAGKERSKYASDCCDGCCECDGEYFDGDDFDADDILCNFEDTDLYDEEDEPESDEV